MEVIEKILSARNLTQACREVVRNRGAAGVDGMSVKELEQYLHQNRTQLTDQLRKGHYHPQAIRGKEIPKGNGKTRLLGIPTVIDRMLQQATAQVLSCMYEREFSERSYGFRPNRNPHQAVVKSLEYINMGFQDIVDIDLQGFFDQVEHSLLLQLLYRKIKCSRTLRLIRRWLRVPILCNGKLQKRRKGVPQGSPLSPLLSNIVLHELDRWLESKGIRFVRYADDFSLYCRSREEARKTGNETYKFLRDKLRLPINREKSGIRRPTTFRILGYGFVPTYRKGEKGKYQLVVDNERFKRFKAELKEITRKTAPVSFDERVRRLKAVYRGWINYFRYASIYARLKEIDGWLRNRLRYCIWHDWKKPERRRKNLIRLSVEPHDAYCWSRSRKGGWAIAQSPILNTTITLDRLEKRGHEGLLTHYLKVCPHYQPSRLPFA